MKVNFAGNPVELQGTEIKVGMKAPDFTAVKNDLSAFKLGEVKGRKLIVAVPSLDTSVCDLEVRRFNAEATGFANTTVITISMDLPFAQKRWCGAAGVDKLVTVSDYKDRDFATKYGVLLPNVGLLARAVFLLDADNTVRYVEYVPEVTSHPDYAAALAALK
ncbi:MAG: thiol peroxidase [Kiritimatiellae bacterium]|jgi:thiol peroxidase|nr:thiol peroxidase [Kiritimatiellia bacterium]NLE40785.1 thiol peroxidase [Lentisphaerota bacterium]